MGQESGGDRSQDQLPPDSFAGIHVLSVDGSGLGWSIAHPPGCADDCDTEHAAGEHMEAWFCATPGDWVVWADDAGRLMWSRLPGLAM